MASRHVLTVNQVVEIMLRWLVSRDWEKAFMEVIPKRKLPEVQGRKEVEDEESEDGQSTASHHHQDSEHMGDEI
jgi:tRNA (guanine9-N1)-methyltransferase